MVLPNQPMKQSRRRDIVWNRGADSAAGLQLNGKTFDAAERSRVLHLLP